jgi:hypothetical protein
MPTAKPLSRALNHDVVRANGQFYVTVKLIRIRLRVNSSQKRSYETKIILRLKGLKINKEARKERKKA